MNSLRALVVAEDPLARGGLAALLAAEASLIVVGRAAPDEDLAATSEALQADVVAWDMGWQGERAAARLAEAALDIPVVALVADEDAARAARAAGAVGALRRDAAAGQIAAALIAASHRLIVMDADYAPRAAPDALRPDEARPLLEELTTRELDVLRLLAEGLPNKSIAQRLDISEHTVKFHVNSLLGKLGATSRTEAVVRATRLGLILL